MRADSLALSNANAANVKEPRFLIVQSLDKENTDLLYLPSHADVALPGGGAVLTGLIEDISATSQKLNPDQGRAEIGSINYKIVDIGGALTTYLSSKYGFGYSIFGKRVQVYFGYEGFAWTDYVLVQTQEVTGNEYSDGTYAIQCHDIQRAMRKDIFEPKKTKLNAAILSTVSEPFTLTVINTFAFEMIEHGTSYSNAPNSTVGYLRINDSFIRYSGKTVTTFTDCVLVFGTRMESFEAGEDIEEVIYLEMPAPKIAYAVLTGILHNQGGAKLPAHWNIGVDTSLVRLADFTRRMDWWDENNDSATLPLRFVAETKTDGKRFLEEQIYLVMGAYSPVYADGALGFRSMVSIIANAPTALELNASNVFNVSALKYDYQSLHNRIRIIWNWNPIKEDFTRDNLLIGANSIGQYGNSSVLTIESRGLHGNIHTEEFLLIRFNSIADRYLSPPERIQLAARFGLNGIEVGDIPRVNLDEVRDFVNTQSLKLYRAMEVQQVQVDWINGGLNLDLFGSTSKGETLSLSSTSVLPDAYYISAGVELQAYLDANYPGAFSLVGEVGHIQLNCTLIGAAAMSEAIYYYDGPLQIDSSAVVTITDNVWLRRRGHLQINGEINGAGQGLPGAVAHTSIPAGGEDEIHRSIGTSGFFGVTRAGGHIERHLVLTLTSNTVYANSLPRGFSGEADNPNYIPPSGRSERIFYRPEILYQNGALSGVPTDLRGTSGGAGGPVLDRILVSWQDDTLTLEVPGGDGGNGGAGLITEGRGLDFGLAGKINLSGLNGQQGAPKLFSGEKSIHSGGGAGGAPGCWLEIKDGDYAIFAGDKFVANQGETPMGAPPMPSDGLVLFPIESFAWSSYYPGYNSPLDQSGVTQQSVPIIGGEIPVADPDIGLLQPPTGLNISSGTAQLLRQADGTITPQALLTWLASPDLRTLGYDVRFKKTSEAIYSSASIALERETVQALISAVNSTDTWDFGIRAAGENRIKSNWVEQLNVTIVGKSQPPANVSTFLVQRQQDGTRELDWTAVRDLDHAGYRIKYISGLNGVWENMADLHTDLLIYSPFETNQLAAGTWTFAIKQVDSTGNESEGALFVNGVVLDDPRMGGSIGSFDPRLLKWPGIKTNCWVAPNGILYAADTKTWADFAIDSITWAGWTSWARAPNSTISYEHLTIDIGVVTTFIPLVSVTANGEITIEEQHSDDDVLYTAWSAVGPQLIARYIKFKVTVTSIVGLINISQMFIILSADPVTEDIEDLDTSTLTGANRIAVGHFKLPITKAYAVIKQVNVVLQNVGPGWTWELISKADLVNGPEIKTYDNGILADATSIDATIKGV